MLLLPPLPPHSLLPLSFSLSPASPPAGIITPSLYPLTLLLSLLSRASASRHRQRIQGLLPSLRVSASRDCVTRGSCSHGPWDAALPVGRRESHPPRHGLTCRCASCSRCLPLTARTSYIEHFAFMYQCICIFIHTVQHMYSSSATCTMHMLCTVQCLLHVAGSASCLLSWGRCR